MKKITALFFLIIIAANVNAYDGWVGATKIKNVRFQSLLTLVQVENMSNPGGCPGTEYLVFRNDNEYSTRFNSALLFAQAAGRNIKLAVTGCENTWPKVTEVWVF